MKNPLLDREIPVCNFGKPRDADLDFSKDCEYYIFICESGLSASVNRSTSILY